MLSSPMKIGRLTIPNRVVMTAMGTFTAAPGGGVNDDVIAFYEARAKGGVGLIITEVTRVTDGAGGGEPCQLAARNPADALELMRLTDAIHKYDTKIFVQLQHPGRAASSAITGETPVAPSVIEGVGGEMPRELSNAEIRALVDKFVMGARVVQMSNADGVELHAAHGYLINEFLSPAMNARTDEYGGSFDNRMRFLLEIIEGIRKTCGRNFPISVRINAEEDYPNGIHLEEAKRIAMALEQAGADAINVSCFNDGCIEPGTYPQGCKKPMTLGIKQAVGIPVIGVSNIKEPDVAEELVREGVCDFAGVARGHLADSDWCRKAFSGRENEIRKCIGCLACFGEIVRCHRAKCAVNPVAFREREYAHPVKNGGGRRVAVVGGGPAGIEAALTLKQRGFAPVIFDPADRLGGTLNVADKGFGKDKITRYVDSLIAQVEAAGIETRLNTEATVQNVSELKPAGVFVACGAEPLVPPVEGLDKSNVITAESVLLAQNKVSGRVAVIGSGMTGLETAEILADAGCALTMIDMLPTVGQGIYPSVVSDVMSRILPRKPAILTGHKLERFSGGKVEMTRLSDGERIAVDADWVVLAMGVRPRRALAEEFKKAFPVVSVVGDANKGGRILEATQDAHGKAFVFMAD